MDNEPVELTNEQKDISIELAQSMVDACAELPIICGVAALISVTGAVCYNEADGDKAEAFRRAGQIAVSVITVIEQLHQTRTGNGHEDDTGIRD